MLPQDGRKPRRRSGNEEEPPSIFTGRSSRPGSSQLNNPPSPKPQHASSSQDAEQEKKSPSTVGSPLGLESTDRVFPMRSFVSVDPTPTPSQRQGEEYFTSSRNPGRGQPPLSSPEGNPAHRTLSFALEEGAEAPGISTKESAEKERSRGRSGSRKSGAQQTEGTSQGFQLFSETASNKSGSVMSTAAQGGTRSIGDQEVGTEDDTTGYVTARFKHIVTDEGHAVITGRDGDTLQRCEDEPIHIPGAVQSFGLLIALQEESEGKVIVRVVSENSRQMIGYSPQQLFALESFTDILSEEQADNLFDHIDFVKEDASEVETNGPEVFTISIRGPSRRSTKLWCAIHINPQHPELIICEFELEDDQRYPLVPANEETPEPPEDTLSSEPTDEEFRESTEVLNRPLRVLRSARKRRGEAAAMEVFNIMSQVQEQLAEAPNLDRFLKVLVGVVKELTGFHRVMIYQFDQNFNGKVVSELVDPRATKDLYKGLHFPASDIPKQARDLYRINRVRLLYDRDLESARLVCRTVQDLETPLDLTHSYLRAMSPIHVKYLRNMAVRSSMSISINVFNELWGLISCHTYGSKGTRVSFPIRKMCRLVGDSASHNIERLSYASRLQARKLINTAPTEKNPSGYIIASSDDLLNLFDADYGMLSIHDETKILGKLEATQEALALLEYCRMRKFTAVVTSQDVRFDFPDLRYPPGFRVVAGILLVPLSVGGNDFIIFFRKGQLREVKWAGNPYEKFVREGTEGFLEPRKSFKMWTENVVGKCREWTEEEVETAAVLCLVYGKFIEVWRQKEAALQNTQLTKLLLANSAHEVRTPLNAIINYLEIALEGSIDQETRDNLSKSHSASKSLIYVINDLLDLTKTEENLELTQGEVFDLKATFSEAVEPFQSDAKRKQISYDIVEHPGVPERVHGAQRRVRQAISNLVANAISATSEGGVTVEIYVTGREDNHVDVEIAVEDTGSGMNTEKLDKLFVELEQAQAGVDAAIEEAIVPSDAGKDQVRILGLGLAVVARIVRNMNGQLRVNSEEGKGSRFVVQFPFSLAESEDTQELPAAGDSEASRSHSESNLTAPHLTGSEMTLVGKASPYRSQAVERRGSPPHGRAPGLSRQNSGGSMGSLGSMNTMSSTGSARSEADRLIEAMQEPHLIEGPSFNRRSSMKRSRSYQTETATAGEESSVHDRSKSFETLASGPKVPAHLRISRTDAPGEQRIESSGQPLRALRLPNEADMSPSESAKTEAMGIDALTSPTAEKSVSMEPPFKVLVAEDDPINSKIVQKRLSKIGHETYLTVNGEECASFYGDAPGLYDVVLMDMQMPIVDGMTSTKMIRSFEKSNPQHKLSHRASKNGRVPIIAVSASLVEKERQTYIDAGFDGWILKPISFPRLAELMKGIVDFNVRRQCLYQPGKWEDGGWFHDAESSTFAASTAPAENAPVSNPSDALEQQAVAEGTASS